MRKYWLAALSGAVLVVVGAITVSCSSDRSSGAADIDTDSTRANAVQMVNDGREAFRLNTSVMRHSGVGLCGCTRR